MLPNVGPLEIVVVLVVALVVFGPKRLPELGSSLGKGIRGFGQGLKGEHEEVPAAPGGEGAQIASSVRQAEGEPEPGPSGAGKAPVSR